MTQPDQPNDNTPNNDPTHAYSQAPDRPTYQRPTTPEPYPATYPDQTANPQNQPAQNYSNYDQQPAPQYLSAADEVALAHQERYAHDVDAATAQKTAPWKIATGLLGVLALVLLIATVILSNKGENSPAPSTQPGPTQTKTVTSTPDATTVTQTQTQTTTAAPRTQTETATKTATETVTSTVTTTVAPTP